MVEQATLRTGWLVKQGGSIKTWKYVCACCHYFDVCCRKRWFVLKGTNLYYYSTDKEIDPIDSIALRGAAVIRKADGMCGKKFSFGVTPLVEYENLHVWADCLQ